MGREALQEAFSRAGRSGGTVSEGHPSSHHDAVLWHWGDLQTCTGGNTIASCTLVNAVYVPKEVKEKPAAGPLPKSTRT